VTCFIEHAPAKLNLYLHVTGIREDGYHTLDSLVAFANCGDTVTVTPSQGLSLTVSGPYAAQVPSGPENLVLKAAALLAERYDVEANAHIALEKNLPVASGIGGGSADAAATLRALSKLWQLKISGEALKLGAEKIGDNPDTRLALQTLFTSWRDDLDTGKMSQLALELGADVPVCLEGRTVYMSGIGETLTLAPLLPKVWVVLVNPHTALSTPDVFKARTGDFSKSAPFFESPKEAQNLADLLKARRNDLCPAAITLAPEIGDVLNTLENLDGCLLARMSGSGATCFGLFANPILALRANQSLARTHPQWWAQTAQLVDSPIPENWLKTNTFKEIS
jgi:4-diphosphocytidyl-2-C-methyl-D-erythritol kinase